MSKFKFAIGLHNHQPVGNFDHVFDEAHNLAYKPFLDIFQKYDNLRISLHQSGILWNWQEKHYREYLERVKKLVSDGRLEILTGGFYEPILPAIPDRDKKGQIAMLNSYVEEKLGTTPKGLWLTERVWEPQLPKLLSDAGVEFLPLDDTHFIYAGLEPHQLKGIFITEDNGATVKLLPIQKKLRYLIPFRKVEEVIAELRRQADENPEGVAIYADDGEKFGVWPKTHEHCYDDGWLEDFFDALSANSDWLEVVPLGEAAATPPVGTAYLPSASYAEMLHWSLPTKAFIEYEDFEQWLEGHGMMEKFGRFVRGGHWRGFLHKYPESNLMHKKMMAVSKQLESFALVNPQKTETIEKARADLYAGQCNCPYWHGVFGGLYLPHIRQAIFEHLNRAEELLTNTDDNYLSREEIDYDADGHDEVVVGTNRAKAVIKPNRGGMLLQYDLYDPPFNLTDTLSRRREGYHRKLKQARLDGEQKSEKNTSSIHDLVLTKEKGLERYLAEDWYLRRCFIDHFFGPDTDIDDFLSGRFHDEGDFVLEPLELIGSSNDGSVHLKRVGHLWRDGKGHEIELQKRYYFAPNSDVISVNYALTALNEDIHGIRMAVENNFNFQAGHADDRYFLFDGEKIKGGFLDSTIMHEKCYSVMMRDDWRDLVTAITVDKNDEIWQVPIFTISLSEGGFEKVYQGTSVVHIVNLGLTKGSPFEISFMMFAGRRHNMPHRFVKASDIKLAGA